MQRSGLCYAISLSVHHGAHFGIGHARASRYGQSVKDGYWQRSPVFALVNQASIELSGKTLGIVGYGNIGKTVAQIARSFGMKVLVAARPETEDSVPAGRVPVEQLFRESDVVSLHCLLTPQTRNLINQKTLAWMKPTAFLINTARGALIDEGALIDALRKKRLAGAALDVISREPPPPDHPVILAGQELNNLIITPHTAWSAREARERLLSEVAENIECFFLGTPRNVVA
ncbi:MAG: NAD(P)-dependent oxidoreductase [Burkholderiales bacterium]